MNKLRNKRKWIVLSVLAVVLAMALAFPIHVIYPSGGVLDGDNAVIKIGRTEFQIVIGDAAAAQTADYTCDGTDDHVQFQAALDALPAAGGQIFILSGDYVWGNAQTVTRAIDDVTIIGVGMAVYISGDGVTSLFDAGGNNWVFSNLETDAGGIDMGATTDWMWLHINVDSTYYALRTDTINVEDHSSTHLVAGGDTIFPADPGEDKYLMWDDDPGNLSWETPVGAGDMEKATYDTDDDGDIDTAAGGTEWDSSAATGVAYITAGAWGTRATGITNTYILIVDDADAVSTDIAYFTAGGLAGYDEAEFKSAYNMEAGTDYQAYDAELAAIAGLTSAADKMIYFTGSGTAAVADLTAFARSILDDADEATFKATVNLEIGTDVLAQQTIGIADDNLLEVDGSPNSAEYARFTANGLEGRTEGEFKADFNLEIGTDILAYDATLTSIAALGTAADKIAYTTGVDTWAETGLTAFARSILDDVDEATFKATVNLEVGTDIISKTTFDSHVIDYNVHGEQNPLYPTHIGCIMRDGRHQGLGSYLFHITGSNKTVIAYRDSSKHASSDADSAIMAVDTYDMGVTLKNERTIYNDTNSTLDALNGAYAVMDDDRFGLMLSRRSVDDNTYNDCVFVYSDDEGVTWSSSVLTGKSHASLFFDIIRYPTSVGGDDDGGWIVFGTALVDATNTKIIAFYTTDNGATWTQAELISSATLGANEYACEPTVARIGAEDKWVMIWRRHQGDNLNAYASKSTDLLTWSSPTDTGEILGDNPPYLMYYNGNFIWYAASRYKDGTIGPITGQPGNTYLYQVVDADDIWTDLTDWVGWTAMASFPYFLTGYLTIRDIEGVYYGITCADGYNDANLYLVSRNPGVTQTLKPKVSDGDKTIYIDKGASGANDGSSWTDAFESWADCQEWLAGWTIAHDWTIQVRAAATPYRETFDMDGFSVWGSLTVEGEYYWNGDCEAQATAGNIKDTTADFSEVEVGDVVYVLDLNGANGRAQAYEVSVVDDISQAGSGIIGTDGSSTATTGWDYTIVKTEISGSDTGLDAGTARDNCVLVQSQNDITIRGFYMTFSDVYVVYVENSGNINVDYCIFEDCDRGLGLGMNSVVYSDYVYCDTTADRYSLLIGELSFAYCNYWALDTNASYAACLAWRNSACILQFFYIDHANQGVLSRDVSWVYTLKGTISSNAAIGLQVAYNGVVQTGYVTNSAVDAVDPDATTEGGYIN